jgi:transcriptional regulator with XRE-family HTH domain
MSSAGKKPRRKDDGNILFTRFGNRVRRLRESRNMNATEFAAHSGISRGHLSELEHGKREPGLLMLQDIADGLGISMSRLLSGL